LQDIFQELKDALCREGFPIDEDEEKLEGRIYEESYQEDPDEFSDVEYPDETFDEDEVLISALPFDEDIQASILPAHQEENMMSCNPFEDLDDTLFHDFGTEEVLEEPLDATGPFGENQTKRSILRIKPLVMKRRWRSMSMKRKKNSDEVQHVEEPCETSLSFLPLDEGEFVQPCFPPAHEVEEVTSINDEEFEDSVEATLAPALRAH
jgi:hypothetical protein